MAGTVGLLLAGGTGTRLYPASRPHRPKQFLDFGAERSLLRQAADRVRFLDDLYAVTRERYRDRVAAIVPEATVLTDPGKDTGPAIVTAVAEIAAREAPSSAPGEPDLVVACFPTDHAVGADGFERAVTRGAQVARETQDLVCLGIEPTRVATEYGYIRPDRPTSPQGTSEPPDNAPIRRFREKPSHDVAARLVDEGWYWNSGIFAWTPAALLREAERSPLASLVETTTNGEPPDDVPAISIDYAVLERTERGRLLACELQWDDLGTWDAVGRQLTGDEAGTATDSNAALGSHLAIDAVGNVIASQDHHISVCGVEDLVIAAYDDRVLVVPREDSDRVREIVAALDE